MPWVENALSIFPMLQVSPPGNLQPTQQQQQRLNDINVCTFPVTMTSTELPGLIFFFF